MVYIYFNKDSLYVMPQYSGVIQVGDANALRKLKKLDLMPTEEGFLYTYVTNRSESTVFFDRLTIKYWKPVVRVQYNYYPYGLPWENPAISGEEALHDCLYQDKEFQFKDFADGDKGLMLYDFHARMYDPATAMWSVPDPAGQFSNSYLAMGNNPVINIDPYGEFVWAPIIIGMMIGATVAAYQAGKQPLTSNGDVVKNIVIGAVVGAVGGAVGQFPLFGTGIGFIQGFAAGLANGMVAGAVTGGVSAALLKQDVGEGILMGGVMGGITGGIGGGIQGVKEVNELNKTDLGIGRYRRIDGAYVKKTTVNDIHSYGLTGQKGEYNCVPAFFENITGEKQSEWRSLFGGNPEIRGVDIKDAIDIYKKETGIRISTQRVIKIPGTKDPISVRLDGEIASFQRRLASGETIGIVLPNEGSEISHTVRLESVTLKTVERQSSAFRARFSFTVMNPGYGNGVGFWSHPSYNDIMKAKVLLFHP